jgi:hypothetical protein
MRVGRFARALVTDGIPCVPALAIACADLAGLIHDAPEAMTGLGDVLRPAKTDGHRETEARAYAAVVDHTCTAKCGHRCSPALRCLTGERTGYDKRSPLSRTSCTRLTTWRCTTRRCCGNPVRAIGRRPWPPIRCRACCSRWCGRAPVNRGRPQYEPRATRWQPRLALCKFGGRGDLSRVDRSP